MENFTPIEFETPNGDNNEEEVNKESVYKLNFENKQYIVILSLLDSNIILFK